MKSLRPASLSCKLGDDFLWSVVVGSLEILVILCLFALFDQFCL